MKTIKIVKTIKRIKANKKILVLCSVALILCISAPTRTYAQDDDQVEVQNLNAGSSGVTIDGYYDDWEDKPISRFTWNSNNGSANHDVSMIKDNDYIYIYLQMHPNYQSNIPTDSIVLTVNNRICLLFIRYANSQNRVDWGHQLNFQNGRTYTGLHVFTYYPDNSLGDAAVTIAQGSPNDTLELRINIKDLEQAMGLDEGTINGGSQIKLNMPNVGSQTIELLGTSTGAVVGILLCVGTVIAVKLHRNKKARVTQ